MRHLLVSGLLLIAAVSDVVARDQAPRISSQQAVFEVASVKRNTQAGVETSVRVDPGGRLSVVGAPLFWLIAGAYGDANGGLRPEQVIWFPSGLRSERYDIAAQAPETAAPGASATFLTMRPFLQSLLEDRFQLRGHRETRELPVYALVLSGQDGAAIHPPC